MDIRATHRTDNHSRTDDTGPARADSAASWGAILAGAAVAIAMSLVLVTLGLGLGFASISPWSNHGIGAGAFTVAAAIWLIVTQWVSSLFGGYITGRLRTRWIGTHEHEIFFRDTANGLEMWAVSTVVVAALVTSSVWSGIGAGAKAVSGVAASGLLAAPSGPSYGAQNSSAVGAAGDSRESGITSAPVPTSAGYSAALAYGVDKLFRASGVPAAGTLGANDPRGEAGRILVNDLDLGSGTVPDADRAYLVTMVAAHTGVSDADAQKRVSELLDSINAAAARVKAQADVARKDGVEVAIYTALSLLIGAFIASVAAALGGRLRDVG